MRGSANIVLTLLTLAVLLMGAYLVFNVPQTKIIQQGAPVAQPGEEKKTVAVWDVLVTVVDDEGRPVTDATVYLLYEEPKNIYKTPTDAKEYLDMKQVGRNKVAHFENVLAGRDYFVLATANGYYNAGKSVTVPKEVRKDATPEDEPVLVDIVMSKVGTLTVWPKDAKYAGSTTDKVKLADEGDGIYATEFEIREAGEGEFRYKKISINTDDGVSFSTIKVYLDGEGLEPVGNSIRFDEEQKFNKNDAVPVRVEIEDFENLGNVTDAIEIVFHDVQDSTNDFGIVIEAPVAQGKDSEKDDKKEDDKKDDE